MICKILQICRNFLSWKTQIAKGFSQVDKVGFCGSLQFVEFLIALWKKCIDILRQNNSRLPNF